jgi:hypothetical protein
MTMPITQKKSENICREAGLCESSSRRMHLTGAASPCPIRVWPKEVGADYLIAQAGRSAERGAALALSEALGGLPLAHEQAAAYCDRLGISLAEYLKRFEATPVNLLDTEKDAPAEYHDRITVAKTFALAIDKAAKLHPAAEPLIIYAALLAPEPIPLFLFSEAREKFGKPFASNLAGDGLDEAVAALRAFALLDRETIPDEREPAITTDCIRLHRLVRQVASSKCDADAEDNIRRELIEVMALTYPAGIHRDPATWPQARRLDAIAVALVARSDDLPKGSEVAAANLLGKLDAYRDGRPGCLCRRAETIGARAGDQRKGARPRSSGHGKEPQQSRQSAAGAGRSCGRTAVLRARADDP